MPLADEPPPPQKRLRGNMGGRGGMPAGALPPNRFIPKGQGILWSVGEDGHDDGGKQQGINNQAMSFGQDLIYLVPPPP